MAMRVPAGQDFPSVSQLMQKNKEKDKKAAEKRDRERENEKKFLEKKQSQRALAQDKEKERLNAKRMQDDKEQRDSAAAFARLGLSTNQTPPSQLNDDARNAAIARLEAERAARKPVPKDKPVGRLSTPAAFANKDTTARPPLEKGKSDAQLARAADASATSGGHSKDKSFGQSSAKDRASMFNRGNSGPVNPQSFSQQNSANSSHARAAAYKGKSLGRLGGSTKEVGTIDHSQAGMKTRAQELKELMEARQQDLVNRPNQAPPVAAGGSSVSDELAKLKGKVSDSNVRKSLANKKFTPAAKPGKSDAANRHCNERANLHVDRATIEKNWATQAGSARVQATSEAWAKAEAISRENRKKQGFAPAPAPAPTPVVPKRKPRSAPAPDPATASSGSSGGADSKFEKFAKMQRMGLPEGAIRLKMSQDGLTDSQIDAFLSGGGGGNSPAAAGAGAVDPMFEKYAKMQRMGLPEGAIRQKMSQGGLTDDQIDDFLAGGGGSSSSAAAGAGGGGSGAPRGVPPPNPGMSALLAQIRKD